MKKGQYFMLDVILALVVMTLGMIIIFSPHMQSATTGQSAQYSSDLVRLMQSMKVDEAAQYWKAARVCIIEGECTEPVQCVEDCKVPLSAYLPRMDESVLSAVARLARTRPELAGYLAKSIAQTAIPARFGFNVTVLGIADLGGRNPGLEFSHRIAANGISYFVNESRMLEGPYVVQVVVWQ